MSSIHNPNQAPDIDYILQHYRRVAVVGLSPKPERDSHEVAHYMQTQGWTIIPVNPMATCAPILGEKVYASLLEAAHNEPIELVCCFRNSVDIPPIATDAIQIGAKAIWMQLGIEHPGAAEQARLAGLRVVQNKCLLIEQSRR
ncbi:MAG: CoA-binding protein [Burkholderiaceae bacterium]